MIQKAFLFAICVSILNVASAEDPATDLPLVFKEDFEDGSGNWETTDAAAWDARTVDGNGVFGLNKRKSNYDPPHRSPHNIALLKGVELADFEITFKVKSTKDTGNHRDCCVFFCHQDATHFYYCHLGAKPDPHSGQIMIVNDAPRKAMTENKNLTPWKNDTWHQGQTDSEFQRRAYSRLFRRHGKTSHGSKGHNVRQRPNRYRLLRRHERLRRHHHSRQVTGSPGRGGGVVGVKTWSVAPPGRSVAA